MKKHQPIPKEYIGFFCKQQDILVCDNLLNPECPRSCNHARKYHPIERKEYLEKMNSENFQSQREFDETFLIDVRGCENGRQT